MSTTPPISLYLLKYPAPEEVLLEGIPLSEIAKAVEDGDADETILSYNDILNAFSLPADVYTPDHHDRLMAEILSNSRCNFFLNVPIPWHHPKYKDDPEVGTKVRGLLKKAVRYYQFGNDTEKILRQIVQLGILAVPELIRTVNKNWYWDGYYAMQALLKIGSDAVPILVEMLNGNEVHKETVIFALGEIGRASIPAIPILEDLAAGSKYAREAGKALDRLREQIR